MRALVTKQQSPHGCLKQGHAAIVFYIVMEITVLVVSCLSFFSIALLMFINIVVSLC